MQHSSNGVACWHGFGHQRMSSSIMKPPKRGAANRVTPACFGNKLKGISSRALQIALQFLVVVALPLLHTSSSRSSSSSMGVAGTCYDACGVTPACVNVRERSWVVWHGRQRFRTDVHHDIVSSGRDGGCMYAHGKSNAGSWLLIAALRLRGGDDKARGQVHDARKAYTKRM